MNPGPPLRILLVEDEIVIGLYLKAELETAGCKVSRWVASGEAGVQAAFETSPDLIIMDIRLSGSLDGIQAALGIREKLDTPIIFISGYQDASIRKRAEEAKPLAYLCKPLRIQELRPFLDAIEPKA